jgi:hypothetical protein
MKYALGLDPFVAYSQMSTGVPYPGVSGSGASRYLTLTFTGTASDVTYSVQATSDLALWSSLYSSSAGIAPGTLTVSDNVLMSSTNKRFMRLQVTQP